MTQPTELKPCPFCGAAAKHIQIEEQSDDNYGGHYIACSRPTCGMSTVLMFACGDDPLPLLRERWNTRAPQPPEAAPVAETGWLVEKHEGCQIKYLRIDNCGEGYAWHADSLQATRFARRQDAEHAAEGGELDDLRIAEHMWSD